MRIALLFDGKNYNSGWHDKAASRPVDLHKLAQWVIWKVGGAEARLVGAHYYTGVETGGAAETDAQARLAKFLSTVELLPGFFVRRFERKAKRMRCRHCNEENAFTQEKEVDTTIVADMLRLAAVDAFDALVLISGDADLTPAVEGVQSLGKQVYVATWAGTGLAKRIRKAAFDHIDLMDGIESFASAPKEAARPIHADAQNPLPLAAQESGENVFLAALKEAEKVFSNGYVGLHHFIKNWKAADLTPDSAIRSRLLDSLLKKGLVEKYTAKDQKEAIRCVPIRPSG